MQSGKNQYSFKLSFMARKSKEVKIQLQEVRSKVTEFEALAALAEKEDQDKLLSVAEHINAKCEASGIFCGIILTPADIINILSLALQSHENIKIPFSLYFND